jgi:DNA invertase Pin-like site-specific DNA recombinase
MDRAELRQVRADARAGRIGTLYVYRLDRLTRSGIRDTLEVVEELREAGVTLRTVADGFDPSGPAAQLILAVMAWAAQMERLAIGERVADARERVAAEGGAWGRPPRFTPQMVETASAMQREGRSVREISVALKVPRATVGRCLKKVAVSQNARSEGNPAPQPPASR